MVIEILFIVALTMAWFLLWKKNRTIYFIWYICLNVLIILSVMGRYYLDIHFSTSDPTFKTTSLALIGFNSLLILAYLVVGARHIFGRKEH